VMAGQGTMGLELMRQVGGEAWDGVSLRVRQASR
jgi:hypothetical protein